MVWYQITIIILALIGLGINSYQFFRRKQDEKRNPVREEHVDPVQLIKYSLFLEIPFEIIVMGGFLIIALVHTGLLITGASVSGLDLTVLGVSGLLFLLLLYELGMQIFVFKRFSFWLISSTIITAIIFIFAEIVLDIHLVKLFIQAREYMLTFHLLGMVLGLGGTLILDLMFFHFIKNYKITRRESVIMHLISQMIILGLGFLVFTGIALYFTDPENYSSSPRFLAKMSAMVVVILNGGALNLYVTPKLKHISFLNDEEQQKHKILKSVAFALGGVSMVSWLSVFAFAMVKDLGEFEYSTLLTGYLILLGLALGGSQLAKLYYAKEAQKDEEQS